MNLVNHVSDFEFFHNSIHIYLKNSSLHLRNNAWWAYGFRVSITPCPWDLCQGPAFDLGLCYIYIRFTSTTGYRELQFFYTCI